MKLRDHDPIVIDQFNGLWKRGDSDSTPLDHFEDCENIKFIGSSSFGSRDGVGIHQSVATPLAKVKRFYNYSTTTGNTLIVLVINSSGYGEIYHVVNSTTVYGPILTINTMTDFAFVAHAGRGYISPFTSYVTGALNIEKGIQNEFVYVYAGDGTAARKAGSPAVTGTLTISNGAAGNTDAGFHLFGVVDETSSGFLSAPGAIAGFSTVGNLSVSFSNVPTSLDSSVVKRHIVATKIIPTYNGNTTGYQFFFIPNAIINNNTGISLSNISFFDADLLQDASYLLDNYVSIPAGAVLSIYHERLCVGATFDDISLFLVSAPGEFEAISQIDGLIVVPPDGNPITNGQELRDIFYVMKRARTVSYTDNGDAPSSWPMVLVDNALGTCVHGIATVLDAGSSTVDFLIIGTYQGITLFNGRYIIPELSWKVDDYWKSLNRNEFRKIQIINAPIQKEIYVVLPTGKMLVGNYANGFDLKRIRWFPVSYFMKINTIAIVNIDEIILGSDGVIV